MGVIAKRRRLQRQLCPCGPGIQAAIARCLFRSAVVAGYPFWDDYSFEVSVKPEKRSPFGLTFYYRDENNYFRFEWDPEQLDKPGSGEIRKNARQAHLEYLEKHRPQILPFRFRHSSASGPCS